MLWAYDLSKFDVARMRNIAVQRVVERGWPEDWHAILNLYGQSGVIDAIKSLPCLNAKDVNFVSVAFGIPLSEMKCYEKKQSTTQHWHS